MSDRLPCASMREHVFDHASGREIPAEAEAHLEECAACRARAVELAELFSARAELAEEDIPPAMLEHSFAAVRAAVEPGPGLLERLWQIKWQLSGATAMAAALALMVVLFPTDEELLQVELHAHRGEVTIVSPTGEQHSVAAGRSRLNVNDSLRTGADSRAWVQIASHRLVAAADTRASLRAASTRGVRLRLDRGTVTADVNPREKSGRRFEVTTPLGRVLVRGTLFQVEADHDRARIAVARGKVRVVPEHGEPFDLAAGEQAFLGPDQERRSGLDRARADAMMQSLEPLTTEPLDRQPESIDEPLALGSEPVDEPEPKRPNRRRKRTEHHALDPEDCEQLEKRTMEMRAAAPKRARALVRAADCFAGRQDRTAALRLYRRVASDFPRTAAGENAAYEIGRHLRETGKPGKARRTFEGFLKRYPSSPLAPEATFWTCVLTIDAGQADAGITCLRRYRKRFPNAGRVQETHLLEATTLRADKSNCAAAIAAYDRYLERPGPMARQARRWREWCEESLAGQEKP